MKNRLIVGFDGSDASRAALRWAAGEAELRQASVGIVSSYEMPAVISGFAASAVASVDMGEVAEALRQDATGAASEVFADHPLVEHDVAVVPSSPAVALAQAAEEADLLVVGNTGAGAVSRFLLGSVARALLGTSPCPVVVVPGEPVPVTNRIVVGTDGSDNAMRAVEWAAHEAARRGSDLVVAHAWKHRYGFTTQGIDLRDGREELDAMLLINRAAPAAREVFGGEVQTEIIEGGDVDALLELARTADLVVVGASGRGRVATALLGSVARSVATHSPCPAVVVR